MKDGCGRQVFVLVIAPKCMGLVGESVSVFVIIDDVFLNFHMNIIEKLLMYKIRA